MYPRIPRPRGLGSLMPRYFRSQIRPREMETKFNPSKMSVQGLAGLRGF